MADFENQAFALEGIKALRRHREGVVARRKVGEAVVTARVCNDVLGTDERRSRDHHPGVNNHGARGILYRALQSASCLLRKNGRRKQRQSYSKNQHRALKPEKSH